MLAGTGITNAQRLTTRDDKRPRSHREEIRTSTNVPLPITIVMWAGLGGFRAPEAPFPAICPGANWKN